MTVDELLEDYIQTHTDPCGDDGRFIDDPTFVYLLKHATLQARQDHERELLKNYGRLPDGYDPVGETF